jgi:hypothetical protein
MKEGISFGSALAMVIGYAHHHDILWTMMDGFLSWFYVIWSAFNYH